MNFSQYELVTELYTKTLSDGTTEKKKCSKTKRVTLSLSFKELNENLLSVRQTYYLQHKYQVYNDKYHWDYILHNQQYGDIFHFDFSENITQILKNEPQSSHFNKAQFSLHCAVRHSSNNVKYEYHLSDDTKHDSAIVSLVVNDLIQDNMPDIIRVKSDNCAVQYKCGEAFHRWYSLSEEVQCKVIVYFGAAGHGKGLVDSMSAFGVKNPLRRAVYAEDFIFDSAQDIVCFLKDKFVSDESKCYYLLESDKIDKKRSEGETLPIKGSSKLHMIAFHLNKSVQVSPSERKYLLL